MTNPTQQLAELHELAMSCPGGVQGCEWWCHGFVLYTKDDLGDPYWQYIDRDMLHQHALDLITASAERWLVKHPIKIGFWWEKDMTENRYHLMVWKCGCKHGIRWNHTLPEALKYAMDQSSSSPG